MFFWHKFDNLTLFDLKTTKKSNFELIKPNQTVLIVSKALEPQLKLIINSQIAIECTCTLYVNDPMQVKYMYTMHAQVHDRRSGTILNIIYIIICIEIIIKSFVFTYMYSASAYLIVFVSEPICILLIQFVVSARSNAIANESFAKWY